MSDYTKELECPKCNGDMKWIPGGPQHFESHCPECHDVDAVLKRDAALLYLLADIRAAAGDPTGKLMQDELVVKIRELRETTDKLPKTEDGVPVVPNVDTIWINPNEAGGWQHDGRVYMSRATAIRTWAHHRDHLWVDHGLIPGNIPNGDHWFGKFYSTREAAEAAMPTPERKP